MKIQIDEGFLPFYVEGYKGKRKRSEEEGEAGGLGRVMRRGVRRGVEVVGEAVGKRRRSQRVKAQWEPSTTLFSIWFGINDNVFSNKTEPLFDEVFKSYAESVDKVRVPPLPILSPLLFLSPLYALPLTLDIPALRRRRPQLPLPKRPQPVPLARAKTRQRKDQRFSTIIQQASQRPRYESLSHV